MSYLCKAADNENLMKSKQLSFQEEEILPETSETKKGFDDDNLKGEEQVNLEKKGSYMYICYSFWVSYKTLTSNANETWIVTKFTLSSYTHTKQYKLICPKAETLQIEHDYVTCYKTKLM